FSAFRYRKAEAIARHARLITPGNPHLAEWASRLNDDVRVIPTTIDTELYRPRPGQGRNGPVCIGWSGSRHTAIYLESMARVLRRAPWRGPASSTRLRRTCLATGRRSRPPPQAEPATRARGAMTRASPGPSAEASGRPGRRRGRRGPSERLPL